MTAVIEKLRRAILAGVVLLLVAGGAILAQDLAVKVTRLAGPVQVRSVGSTSWARATLDQILGKGDALRTLKGGKVQLLFPGNNVVLIKENSVLSLKELGKDGSGKVKTLAGGFLFNLKAALSPGSSFEVETPTALAVVRGTKFGVDIQPDGTTVFTGYEGTFEVVAAGETFQVGPGQKLQVDDEGQPGKVGSAEEEWPEDIFAPGESAGIAPDTLVAGCAALRTRYRELYERIHEQFFREFQRYEQAGDQARMSFIYYNMQEQMRLYSGLESRYAQLLDVLRDDPLLSWIPAGTEPIHGTEEQGNKLRGCLEDIDRFRSAIEDDYAYIEETVLEFAPSSEELLDRMRGTIESAHPTMDIRYGTLDTDGDGIPDVVELALGIQPGSDEYPIILMAPDDGAEFAFPDDRSISFEWELNHEECFNNFDLVIEAGGITSTRELTGTSAEVLINSLINGTPSFASLFTDEEPVEFSWFVRGYFDFESFMESSGWSWGGTDEYGHHDGWHESSSIQDPSAVPVTSEVRHFRLRYAPSGIVDLSLTPVGPSTVEMGNTIRVRLEMGDVTNLMSWSIVLTYDPSMVEFSRGNKAGLTSGSTLFFYDDEHGRVAVSGQVPSGAEPISGSGAFAELEFMPLEVGTALFDIVEASLSGPGDQPIGVGGMVGTDIIIEQESETGFEQ